MVFSHHLYNLLENKHCSICSAYR